MQRLIKFFPNCSKCLKKVNSVGYVNFSSSYKEHWLCKKCWPTEFNKLDKLEKELYVQKI